MAQSGPGNDTGNKIIQNNNNDEYEEEEEEEEEHNEINNQTKTNSSNQLGALFSNIIKSLLHTENQNTENPKTSTNQNELNELNENEYEEEEEEEEEEKEEIKDQNGEKNNLEQIPNSITSKLIQDNDNEIDEEEEESHEIEQSNIIPQINQNNSPKSKQPHQQLTLDELMITAIKSKIQQNNQKKVKRNSRIFSPDEDHYDNLDPEIVKKELEKFMKTHKLPSKEYRVGVAIMAREKALELMASEDFQKAHDYKTAAENLTEIIKENEQNMDEQEITDDIRIRIEYANHEQKEIDTKYKDMIDNFEKLRQESHDRMIERHNDEMNHLIQSWDNERKLYPYSKQSKTLLQLRRMQKSQAITMNFVGAKQMKLEADRLQKEETLSAKLNASKAMKAECDALLEKQKKEIESWTVNWDRKRSKLEMDKQVEETANLNLRNQLTVKLTGKKIVKKQSVLFPAITTRSTGQSTTSLTSRARSVMFDYRSKPDAARLDLRSAEIKAIVKPKLHLSKLSKTTT